MVKIFIGNLSQDTERDAIEKLFAAYGTVTECAKYTNFAFVHMDDRKSATKAIRELNQHKLDGRPINVEPSRGKNKGPLKLHIANVERGFEKELQELFEEYGTVTECAIVKDFAFVHMSNCDEAMDAMQFLDNIEFQGKRIHVQVSKSRPRGYNEEEEDYPPPPARGGPAPYPPRFPGHRPEPPYGGHMSPYPPPPPPPRGASYPERPAYAYAGRGGYGSHGSHAGYGSYGRHGAVDIYEKYRARAAGYDDRRAIPPPPPPSALVRERLGIGAPSPYERHPLPPPSPYAPRDRSPIRRIPLPPAPTPGNGYSYERSRLPPMSRAPMYPGARSSYSYPDRVPPPPPPPPRYSGY
ncbi:RNA-binding protein 4.1-like [Cololabis saira]|uniref:RNA-binding protein 4.1-like n=1 Tax=Cololabis saira TaxID=129043 RepID=UPI002AD1D551|nr:RNA-binding protein 4.1-like [Cololabis saira]XP_061566616.1 RNA-binding protein 4.1-like [Cololabis saira]XP_061566617.1 RNA-binding protein 4.1-like [Cololabis saira]XP_061566618.1 RNA-binding protein 4.1-like [Cololabis saira]